VSFLAPLQGEVVGCLYPGVKTPDFMIIPLQGICFH